MSGGSVRVGRLVVCPTPIGNLDDLTPRVLEALRSADLIACEDTRRTRVLLDRNGIAARPVALHDRNERSAAPGIVERIRSGERVALVSDAGTPVVSDPGFMLIRACIESGLHVEVLPGATAVTTALVASGLPAGSFRFTGFLPRRAGDLERVLTGTADTLVAFESPKRIGATLAKLAELDPGRRVAVCRELTKLHEEVARGTASELAERFSSEAVKGEITVVIAPPDLVDPDAGEAAAAVSDLVEAGARPRIAAKVVARLTGLRANDLYSAGGATRGDGTGDAD